MSRILILHGPNLDVLGKREPGIYGKDTLETINQKLKVLAKSAGHELECFQSNAEHELIGRIHQTQTEKTAFVLFNPAAFTHTSVALRDALLAVSIPFIEIHLSNIHKRESFRHQSFFSDIARGVICGFGSLGYELALKAAIDELKS